MEICVKTQRKKMFTLKVESSDTIRRVKEKIEEKEGIPPRDQQLACGLYELDKEEQTLSDYDIRNKCIVYMSEKELDEKRMRIFVLTLDGKRIPIKVDRTATVYDLKRRIHLKTNTPVDMQMLLFNMENLNNADPLSDYKVTNGCNLYLVRNLEGYYTFLRI